MRTFQGIRLRNLRLQHGYSLEMTARILALRAKRRVSRSAISHWELGRSLPSIGSLLALGETFQVPLDYFFSPIPNYLFGKGIHAELFLDSQLLATALTDTEDREPNPTADAAAVALANAAAPLPLETVGESVPPRRAPMGV
jgi:transcriptional regulator with XRE-family HTH domain